MSAASLCGSSLPSTSSYPLSPSSTDLEPACAPAAISQELPVEMEEQFGGSSGMPPGPRFQARLKTGPAHAIWPDSVLPIEIYDNIASHLGFDDLCRMRLVNKEFHRKISEILFQSMTLAYHPDLMCPGSNAHVLLRRLGPHFRRFAVYSEVSDLDIASAPVVSSQSIVTSWWGVYRWPSSRPPPSLYAKLGETCREPFGLAGTLDGLPNVHSIGICIDSGLGYLTGDIRRPSHHPRTFPQDSVSWSWLPRGFCAAPDIDAKSTDSYLLRSMFLDAGFERHQIEEGMRLLRVHEGKPSPHADLGASGVPALPEGPPVADAIQPSSLLRNMTQLVQPQLWMLLQSQRAQRSLLSCFAEAVFLSPKFASNLINLRISKLSSSLIPILSSHSFWESLPSVHTLFLGVIPDWRLIDSVGEEALGIQLDKPISPLSALGPTFDLLNDYVGPREAISTVHFEWVCGGEFAIKGQQRNRYILPAPLAKSVDEILQWPPQAESANLLHLPHVRKLSLKNAWTPAGILRRFVTSMNRSKLRHLELESISMSGPLRREPHPSAEASLSLAVKHLMGSRPPTLDYKIQHVNPPHFGKPPSETGLRSIRRNDSLLGNAANHVPNPHPFVRSLPRPSVKRPPSADTWSYFVDFFTPTQTIDHYMSCLPNEEPPSPRPLAHPKLLDMSFKSCGYAWLGDSRVDNRPILPQLAYINLNNILLASRPAAPAAQIQLPAAQHGDILAAATGAPVFQIPVVEAVLGEVVNYLDPDESMTLECVFGLRQTWHGGVYPSEVLEEAYQHCGTPWEHLGGGRFSGIVSADDAVRMGYVQISDPEA